jgi:hypothetical protein
MDMQAFNAVLESDLPEIEKLAKTFEMVTGMYIEDYERQVDLLRSVKERDALVKEQIKLELMKHARGIFADCYFRVAGRRPWDG